MSNKGNGYIGKIKNGGSQNVHAPNQNVEPLPGVLRTPKGNPCSTRMARTMDSPSPAPGRPLACRAR